MKVSLEEVTEAILSNDTARVAEMMEGFHLTKDGNPPRFTAASKDFANLVLGLASATSYHDSLSRDLAEELIERTAMTVNIFPFLWLVVAGAKIEAEGFEVIPAKVLLALLMDGYSDEIAHAIDALDDEAFKTLLVFIAEGKIEASSIKFNLPILRRIHKEEIIPEDLMLAYMGLCPRETLCSGCVQDTLGALGGIILLEDLFDKMRREDDEECEEPEEE